MRLNVKELTSSSPPVPGFFVLDNVLGNVTPGPAPVGCLESFLAAFARSFAALAFPLALALAAFVLVLELVFFFSLISVDVTRKDACLFCVVFSFMTNDWIVSLGTGVRNQLS